MNDTARHPDSQTAPQRRVQVISISPNGALEALRAKKGQGLDLRQFGQAEVKRVSEILFDDKAQKFYVSFLEGQLAGRILTPALYTAATGKPTAALPGKMLFDDYEDGVAAEVEVLDALRKSGMTFQPHVLERLSSGLA